MNGHIVHHGSKLNINGGKCSLINNNSGTLNVTGGVVGTILNKSTVLISGGIISNGIHNGSQHFPKGTLDISGGKICGGIVNTGKKGANDTQLTISKGIVQGGITDNYSMTILHIKNGSDILVEGTWAFTERPRIEADTDYAGSLLYYNSYNSSGVKMTIQEAANIDYTQPYIRLVADGAVGGPSGGDQEDCQHDYTSVVTAPTCTERGYTTHTCGKCGHSYQDSYINALGHSFGAWVVIREATSTTAGVRERVCSVCKNKETDAIPAAGGSGGSSGSSDDDSDDSDRSSDDSDRTPSDPRRHQISSSRNVTGGSVSLNKTTAAVGETVTVIVRPDKGYELDTLQVLDSSGKELSLRKENSKYAFVMPNGKVSLNAVFRRIEQEEEPIQTPSSIFSDISNSHWAKDAIGWVSSNGYMNGKTSTKFDPDGSITRQQLWMILARLSGQSPADMAEATTWAVSSGLSDGTNPGAPMTRQQMAAFLYRYCGMKGYPISGNGDLTSFPDSGSVSNYAKDALSWAVGSGILTGTKAGELNPSGTATRAQFAVVLQRFCGNTYHD